MGFHSDMSSLPNSATDSTSSSQSKHSSTLAGEQTDSSLNRTLTSANVDRATLRTAVRPRHVQSNVDLYISDEVDGSFHHANSPAPSSGSSRRDGGKSKTIMSASRLQSGSRGPTGSPRLKQTNLPVLRSVTNQPFDELIGVEFVEQEDVMSSSDGFDILTVSGESDRVVAADSEGGEVSKST